jgi:hypothetical protein
MLVCAYLRTHKSAPSAGAVAIRDVAALHVGCQIHENQANDKKG